MSEIKEEILKTEEKEVKMQELTIKNPYKDDPSVVYFGCCLEK